MRYAIITCSTKLSILAPPQIFSGEIPFEDISGWLSLRSHVVNHAKRPAKPRPQVDIGREFDDKLWNLIEECWSQEPSDRPTAANVSLRLGGVNGCLVNPAEMYKKEIAALTEELARERERSKAARQDFETELTTLTEELAREREGRKAARQDFETGLAKLRNSLERRELEQVELKKDLKQAEKNADESKAARQDLVTELANLRNSLLEARREIPILRTDGTGLSQNEPMAIVHRPLIPDGKYGIKNRAKDYYWNSAGLNPMQKTVYFYSGCSYGGDIADLTDLKVNNNSPTLQMK